MMLDTAPERVTSEPGLLYRLTISPASGQPIDFEKLLRATQSLHSDLVHIIFGYRCSDVTMTIPALGEPEETTQIVRDCLLAGLESSRSVSHSRPQAVRAEWPEYVLWPDHILSFFDSNSRSKILELDTHN